MKKMSQKKYVEQDGIHCPFCDSTNLCGDSVEIDGGGATQPVSCNDCGKRWIDCYELTGYIEQ